MSFLQAAFLAGLLGVVVPIAIHLLNRRKAAAVRFPCLRFLEEIDRRRARVSRINERWVLALRVLALAVLALALSRPVLHQGLLGRGRATRVFVVDNSMSSGARTGGTAALERCRSVVAELARRFQPGDRGAVIPVLSDPSDAAALTESRLALEAAARAVEPTYGTTPVAEALRRAIALVSDDDNPVREICLASDLQASAWRDADGPIELPDGVRLIVLQPRAPPRANAAFSRVEVRRTRDDEPYVRARLRAFGEQDVVVRLAFRVAGKPVAERAVRVPVEGEAVVDFRAPELAAGEHRAVLEIRDDALALDNEVELTIATLEPRRVLLVRAAGAAGGVRDPAFYLSRALVPRRRNRAGLQVRATTTDRLGSLDLAEFHVVFLLQPARLDAQVGGALAEFVRAGGGLFVSAGPLEDPGVFAVLESGGESVFPVVPGATVHADREPIHLSRWLAEHEIWAPLVSAQPPLRPDEPGFIAHRALTLAPGARVLAEFDTGAPALVERSAGFGKVLYFASSVSEAWGNLPLRFVFAPLMHSTVDYLAAGTGPSEWAPVGAPLVVRYPRQESLVEVSATLPDGTTRRTTAAASGAEAVELDLGTPSRPGLIAVREKYEDRDLRRWIGVRTDLGESDLRPLADDRIEALLPGAELVEFASLRDALEGIVPLTVGSELVTPLLLLLLMLLVLEPLFANRSARREAEEAR